MSKKLSPVSIQADASPAIVIQPISVDYQTAANMLGVSVRQVRTLALERKLTAIPLGKKHVFSVEDLRAFIQRQQIKAAA